MPRKVRQWLGTHREAIISILLVVLIFAGLVIIWGGGEGEDGEEGMTVVMTTPTSYVPNTWANEWTGAWRWVDDESHRTTTTMRANRSSKTRTVFPNHATTQPRYDDGSIWIALANCESGGRWHLDGQYDGGLQFHPDTWRSVRAEDDPDTEENEGDPEYAWQASPERQIAAAVRLQARSGWGQWPRCSRKLGLR